MVWWGETLVFPYPLSVTWFSQQNSSSPLRTTLLVFMHDLPDAGWDVPGWMLAKIVNDYFAGWEPITLGATDIEFDETTSELVGTSSCATQTDFCHVGFSGPTEAKEAAPGRAPPLERAFPIGMNGPHPPASRAFARWPPLNPNSSRARCAHPLAVPESKEPKRAGISWSPPGELHANQQEILFSSFLLVCNAERVGDLEKWATSACAEHFAAYTIFRVVRAFDPNFASVHVDFCVCGHHVC